MANVSLTLTYTPTTLQEVLMQLNLSQYHDALIEAGYDMLNRFDTENLSMTELTEELKEDVPMKKPHARALVRYLFSQQHQPLLSAPAAQNVDDDDLPIAEAIPMSRVLNNLPSVDPQLLEKEMRDQMERDYESKAANERAVLMEEHADMSDTLEEKTIKLKKLYKKFKYLSDEYKEVVEESRVDREEGTFQNIERMNNVVKLCVTIK